MADDLPPVSEDIVALMEKLAADLPRLPDSKEASRRLEWLIDALIWRGQLPEHFREMAKKIRYEREAGGGQHVVRLSVVDDKRSVPNSDVDCASRIPLCRARCCSFNVPLSKEDIAEGLPWVIERPYELPRDPKTKRCVCMNEQGACTIYEKRPATCREYDCREDRRVWIDFEARIPAPLPEFADPDR